MDIFEDKEPLEHCSDKEGNRYKIRKTVFQGEDVTFPPGYSGLNCVLNNVGSLQCKPQDIVLLTFPKAGTHWVNKIVSMLLGLQYTSVSLESTFIDIMKNFENRETGSKPTIYGSHLKMKYLPKRLLHQQKVIYVIRNPKSIAVSAYSYRIRNQESEYKGSFSGYLPIFLQAEFTCFGNWFDHVKSYWQSLAGKSNVLFVVYEELKRNPRSVIKDISLFLGCEHTENFLGQVAEESSFREMRQKEQAEMMCEGTEGITDWKAGEEGFLRKGVVDDWKNYFTVAENERFDSIFSSELDSMPELRDRIQFE